VTDQPPSHQPAEEPEGDEPAALVADDTPTQVSPPAAPPAQVSPPAAAPAAPEPATPEPPPAFTPPPPPPPPAPPSAAEPSSSEAASAGPDGGLAAAFPSDRPERAVGAAFAGGLVLALILKRLAR
jgi:hypothetical protein